MSGLSANYVLANGVTIPKIGLGTWQTPDGDVAVSSVKSALELGYRHIDTAQGYHNELSVGQGMKESGIDRSQIFLTTKIWNANHSYELAKASLEKSLHELATDYLDLVLIHWPNPLAFRENWQQANADTWRALEEFYEAGKIKAIGVSNFRPHHLEALAETAKIQPMVNQIFVAPGELQPETVAYCKEAKILIEAYSPLGTGKIFEVKLMQELSQKYQKSIAQIAVRWSLQQGFLPLPKSVTPSRIKENADVFDFVLSEEDMHQINELDGVIGYALDPDTTEF